MKDNTDTALEIAKMLYKNGADLNDIWLIGNNMKAMTVDEYWKERITDERNPE